VLRSGINLQINGWSKRCVPPVGLLCFVVPDGASLPQLWRGDADAIRKLQAAALTATQNTVKEEEELLAALTPKKETAAPVVPPVDPASPLKLPRLAWAAIVSGLPGGHLTDVGLTCRYFHGITAAASFMPHRRAWAKARREGDQHVEGVGAAFADVLEALAPSGPGGFRPITELGAVERKVWRVAIGGGGGPGAAQGFFLSALSQPPAVAVAEVAALFRRCATAQAEIDKLYLLAMLCGGIEEGLEPEAAVGMEDDVVPDAPVGRLVAHALHAAERSVSCADPARGCRPGRDSGKPHLTRQQREVVLAMSRDVPMLVVNAYAGTGKTHTLAAAAASSPRLRILYVAFNKAIATESKSRFPTNVDCRTLHSVAYGAVGHLYAAKLIANLRPRQVATTLLVPLPLAQAACRVLNRYLTSAALQLGPEHIRPEELAGLERDLGRNPEVPAVAVDEEGGGVGEGAGTSIEVRVLGCASSLWEGMQDVERRDLGMVHDGYVKLMQTRRTPIPGGYQAIMLDEAQDCTECQLALLGGQKARRIHVGDAHQRIYSFRGALAASLAEGAMVRGEEPPTRDEGQAAGADRSSVVPPPCVEMSLTQTFRCPPAVCTVANAVLRQCKGEWAELEPMALLPRGRLIRRGGIQAALQLLGPFTLIARTNARLVTAEAEVRAAGRNIRYLDDKKSYSTGTDLLKEVIHFKRTGHNSNEPLLKPYPDFEALAEALKTHKIKDAELRSAAQLVVSHGGSSLEQLLRPQAGSAAAAAVALDPAAGEVILTTVHKAKGLEWDSVALADDFSPIGPEALPHQEADEANMYYVALTRAKRTLVCNAELDALLERAEREQFPERVVPVAEKPEAGEGCTTKLQGGSTCRGILHNGAIGLALFPAGWGAQKGKPRRVCFHCASRRSPALVQLCSWQ